MLIYLIIRSAIYGFSFYSIIYLFFLAIRSEWKKNEIKSLDKSACILFAIGGILFLMMYAWDVYSRYNLYRNERAGFHFINPFSPENWLVIWTQPTLYFITSQLMWISRLQKAIWLRILVILIMLFPTERLIILITSFHREYIPFSWTVPFIYVMETWISYIFVFTVSLILFHLLLQVIRKKPGTETN